jgi:hypothetical protein
MSNRLTYNKNQYDSGQLMSEINNSPDIQATVIQILNNDDNITLEFNQTLQAVEIPVVDKIVNDHVPKPLEIPEVLLPFSNLGNKLSVHASSMPLKEGKVFYDVYLGAGDNEETGELGDGEMLAFDLYPSIPSKEIHVWFNPAYGDVYLHGGMVKYENGELGDHITADIMASPTPVQTVQNLDLIIDENGLIKFSPSGPGTGTHGFGGMPILAPRTFSKDGDWDYDGENLLPNFEGKGNYNISVNEQPVHRYVNRLACLGSSGTYVELESHEAAFIPPGYYLCIKAINHSRSAWKANVICNIYRERTINP